MKNNDLDLIAKENKTMFDNCNKCGKILEYGERNIVTCKHITFWEHDTKRYLCSKCYESFKKYMEKHYENFFTYLKEKNNEI